MPKPNYNKRNLALGITGLMMGVLFGLQSKSFVDSVSYNRENQSNVFKEIQIVKESNDNLRLEVADLETGLANSSDQEAALENIKKEIEKYNILLGNIEIEGPGIVMQINKNLEIIWFNDLVNELYSAGAEVVSINGFRLNERLSGFDNMPNGQILLGGEILSAPYEIIAIGDSENMFKALTQAGGIIERINNYKLENIVEVVEQDNLQMAKSTMESF
ncbi:MAG: DUF881 domain-containing protein [Candidatus Altimarinota bacterium]